MVPLNVATGKFSAHRWKTVFRKVPWVVGPSESRESTNLTYGLGRVWAARLQAAARAALSIRLGPSVTDTEWDGASRKLLQLHFRAPAQPHTRRSGLAYNSLRSAVRSTHLRMPHTKELKEMKLSRCFRLAIIVTASVNLFVPGGQAQDGAPTPQATPAISGSGNAGRIAVWKNSTTLASSVMSQSAGNIGIGTTAPAAKLEVNGDSQVDGNFSFRGSILLSGADSHLGTERWIK